jgi:hypothetical protein
LATVCKYSHAAVERVARAVWVASPRGPRGADSIENPLSWVRDAHRGHGVTSGRPWLRLPARGSDP